LNRSAAFLAALFGLALWSGSHASANFADSSGFSGRGGFTCVACHTQPSPTNNDAVAHLDGLPAGWEPGKSYELHVSVTGGPPSMPAPQAQGGFDLATDHGSLSGDPALLRWPSHDEITYRPAGTHQRAWTVTWTAPSLATRPAPAKFWLAVLAANGNHVVAANASDGGETLDAAASLQATVAPSPATTAAWAAIPLAGPTVTVTRDATGWVVDGHQSDANATGIGLRLDGGEWTSREAGPDWRVAIPGNATHTLEVRSEGAARQSPVQALALGEAEAPANSSAMKASPLPVPMFAIAVAAILRRKP